MTEGTRVTAVTVLHNNAGLVPELADTLSRLETGAVLYDSGSTDGSPAKAAMLIPGAVMIRGENRGFGHGNNRALAMVESEYVLLLNSDARVSRESLELLVAHLDANPATAAVQPLIRAWRWPLVTAGSGVYVNPFGAAWDARFMHLERAAGSGAVAVPAVSAAVSLWRTGALTGIGGFDTGYFMYFEDADLCLRASAAGWDFAVLRHVPALHMVGASSSRQRASLWELASSARLARRFLGGGRLPRGFLAREARVEIGLLIRGKPWIQRLGVLLRALQPTVEPVRLPVHVERMLHGDPRDMPLPRPGPRGPGFCGDLLSPFGVFRSDGSRVLLRSPWGTVKGGMCDGAGDTRTRFAAAPGEIVEVRLLSDGGLSYIFCEDPRSRLEVIPGEQS